MKSKRIPGTLFLWCALNQSPQAQVPEDLSLVDLGISPSTTLALRHAGDGTNRLFLVERPGTIAIFLAGSGLLGTPLLDISSDVDTFFEGGLLGLAFHPDFSSNRYFYVYYTRTGNDGNPLETVVERFTVSDANDDVADMASRQTVFTLDQPAGNHNAGDIHFGPDGYLYIGLGDGGSSSSTSQDNNTLLGKMLRIDPCATEICAQGYLVPTDNPFFDAPGLDEIWASGLRNPYRWSFDRQTGDIFIADVGQNDREEVSFQSADSVGGDNYGWNCREGDIAGPGNCAGSFVEPIIVYSSSSGSGNCSITGGYRYRGCIEGLQGKYVFGDYCSSRIWFATETTPGNWSSSEWINLSGNIFGFGEDEAGELYVSRGNTISRFESPGSCTDHIFHDGFESSD